MIQLPDELQHAIERQVAEGRATSAAAFLEEAVLRLIEDARVEENEVIAAAQAGIADIEPGRFTTVGTAESEQRLYEHTMARLRAHVIAEE